MSLTIPTSPYWISSTSNKEVYTLSTISYTHSFTMSWESPSYTSSPSVNHTSTTPFSQVATSFRRTQTVHASTTPLFRQPPTISHEGLSLIASLSATTISQPLTGNTSIQSTNVDNDDELSTFLGKRDSTQSALPRLTLRSVLHSTNTIIAFNSVFANESIGMNQTLADGDQKAMTDKVRLYP